MPRVDSEDFRAYAWVDKDVGKRKAKTKMTHELVVEDYDGLLVGAVKCNLVYVFRCRSVHASQRKASDLVLPSSFWTKLRLAIVRHWRRRHIICCLDGCGRTRVCL